MTTVKILLEIELRDLNAKERKDEHVTKEASTGMAEADIGSELADIIAFHIMENQDEILAGSDMMVKFTEVVGKEA